MSSIERLKGFKDYYPEDQEVREHIFEIMRKTAKIYGFLPIDYPSIEFLRMYQIKSGDELVSQTYSFRDKGDREVTLIPEATPSTVRLLLAKKDIPKPVKWYNIPKLWRYEEPQSGRNREHFQFNCDFFGEPTDQADVEIIALACQTLDELGLKGLYEVRLNERKLMVKILLMFGANEPQKCLQIIDRINKETRENTIDKLKAQGIVSDQIDSLMNFLSSSYRLEDAKTLPIAGINSLEEMGYLITLMEKLRTYGFENIVFNPSTVRGLSYYTGIVFEGFDRNGNLRSIFGGGRYDNLTSLLGGESVPAVGFGMGDAVLEKLLIENDLWKINRMNRSYFVIGKGDNGRIIAGNVANLLRKNHVITELDLTGKSIAKSVGRASSKGFSMVVIVGDEEAHKKCVQLKELETGIQQELSIEQLMEYTMRDTQSINLS